MTVSREETQEEVKSIKYWCLFPLEAKGKYHLVFFHATLDSLNVSKGVDSQSKETRADDFQSILWLLASIPVLCCGLTCRVEQLFSEMRPEEIMPRPMETPSLTPEPWLS